MKKYIRITILLMTLVTASAASYAREPVPIVDYNDVPILTSSGKPVTAEQVRAGITTAASNLRWEVSKSPSQDLLAATLHVRGKHTVIVSIPYSVEKYSIRYESSVNMKYRPADTTPAMNYSPGAAAQTTRATMTPALIHPYYNRWVQELLQSIKNEMNKL
jgi:hypothetical protein